MPLHVRRRRDTGALEIYGTVRPAGTKEGFRVKCRAGSDNEATAREEAVLIEREILRRHHLGERPSVRPFAAALRSYLTHQQRSVRTLKTAARLERHFGETPLDRINQETVDAACAVLCREGATPATKLRQVVAPLRAILVHAAKRGWCAVPLFDAPHVDRRRPDFLLPAQAEALCSAAAPHLQPLLRFLFYTGCRLGEALALEWRDVDLAGAKAILWEGETKGGARRVVELVPAAVDSLRGIQHRTGRVFLTQRRQPYRSSEEGGGQIKRAWATACRDAGLPGEMVEVQRHITYRGGDAGLSQWVRVFRPEHTPHVARHSWATWWYALTPDPMRLMAAGGWSNVQLVLRYTKIMPAGYEDEIRRFWGMNTQATRVPAAVR